VELGPREVLYETQDEIQHVHFLHSGMISLLTLTDDGEAIETAAIGSEGAVGVVAALGMRRASCRAIVQVPGTASRIAASQLQKAVSESRGIREIIMRHQEALLVQAQQTAACSGLHGVEARLARWLLQTQDRTGNSTIPLIQEFLAQVLGVRRTTINLVVRTLHQAGLIRYRRGQIEILDRNGLKQESCACYQVIRRQVDQVLPPARVEVDA
jgi:CRP-like cAMP-binding protein